MIKNHHVEVGIPAIKKGLSGEVTRIIKLERKEEC